MEFDINLSREQRDAHTPVMAREVMEMLDLPPGGTAVDGTLGLAGHARLMAQRLGPKGHLIGIDRDSTSLAEAGKRLADLPLRIDLLRGNFSDIHRFLAQAKVTAVDGILLDLGISSFQLDDSTRGLSFQKEGPLDMRMDLGQDVTAADIVNTWPQEELARIIWEFGEERFSRRIAKAIVYWRGSEKIMTTQALARTVLTALPKGYTRGKIHPATRTFQALRIAVNDEMGSLAKGLDACFEALKTGGCLCVIAFHSLEDRIVKNKFRCEHDKKTGQMLTKKPLRPTDEESQANPRSRSARLRAIQRLTCS